MTRDDIIKELVNDKEYRRICNKIAGNTGLGDDLYSELMLSLIEFKHLEKVYRESEGKFFFYVIRCALNMFRNKRSKFNKTYRANYAELDDNKEMMMEQEIKIDIEAVSAKVYAEIESIKQSYGNNFPYQVGLLQLYLKYGTLRKLSRETGIPLSSCYNTLKEIRQKISNNVKLSDYIDS
jgi:DNA-directed RNA polymerase specialized sigma24 family protein